jgi:hypothetical protein
VFSQHANRYISTIRVLNTEIIPDLASISEQEVDDGSAWVIDPDAEQSLDRLDAEMRHNPDHQPGLASVIGAALGLNDAARKTLVNALGFSGQRIEEIGAAAQVAPSLPSSSGFFAAAGTCPSYATVVRQPVQPGQLSQAVKTAMSLKPTGDDVDSAFITTHAGKLVLKGDTGDPNVGYHTGGKFMGLPLSVNTDKSMKALLRRKRQYGLNSKYWDTDVWYWNNKLFLAQRKGNASSYAEVQLRKKMRQAKAVLTAAHSALRSAGSVYNTDWSYAKKGQNVLGEELSLQAQAVLSPLLGDIEDAKVVVNIIQEELNNLLKKEDEED